MKPAPLAFWIPCLIAAASAHVLLAEWAASCDLPVALAPAAVPDFELRLAPSTVLQSGAADSRFDPRESLDECGEMVSCGYSIEMIDGLEVHIPHCWWGRTDELDFRDSLIAEIADEGAGVEWAGDYFRGAEHASAAALTLGPCGGAWGRECSLADGVGEGLAGEVVEHMDGSLEIRLGRDECVRKSLWPVQWGERRYLVEPPRLEEFLQQARAGAEPRDSSYGSYLLRVGDEHLPVAGEPRIVEIVR